MTDIVHFSGFKGENVIILYLIVYSARNRNGTYIAAHFFGLQSEIVNFGYYPLFRTLFGTLPKFDIHRTFSFLVYRVKKVNFDHSLSHTL